MTATTTEQLAGELAGENSMPVAWRSAFLAVPRHRFLPPQFWVDDETGRPHPLSVHDKPDQWRAAAYRNVPILTQFDDGDTVWPDTSGQACTSSASKPDLVLKMLDVLDVRAGDKVLEIGTGTGYNAALLAARLGAANVTTIEIDPGLARNAHTALNTTGFPARVVIGDGTEGFRAGAPYDRILATAAVRVGELPSSWVAQTRPGGVIVTPMRTDFSGTVALVRIVVGDQGRTATGQPVGRVAFMPTRSQRTPRWTVADVDPDDPAADTSTTTLKPWRVAESNDARWAVGTQVPSCVWEHQPPTCGRPYHLLWLLDPAGGSWAVASYDTGAGPRLVRQHGPRRLWHEVEAAFRRWATAGKPPLETSWLTISPTVQTIHPAHRTVAVA
jgi:protein-L-isoaspartate(D-aspartate) O-methyltransferase